jgi:type I restriction enzyme S subunit
MSARALLQRFDIIADQPSNIPALRRLVVDLAVRGKLLPIESFDMSAQEMLRRISSKADELVMAGAIKKLKSSSKIGDDEVPAAYLAHCTFARLGKIANLQKGLTGIQGSLPGQFPLVVTAAERGTCDHFDFDGAAAIIPLVSSTGHGNASINRLHYQDGKFALGTILCAVFPFDEQLISARFLFEYLTAFKEELLVSKMIGTANVTLTLGKIADVPVPIVAPAVQKRVDELMALCDQLEAAQQERERRRDRLAAASLQRLNQPAADTPPETQREHARFHLHHLPHLTTRPEHIKAMRQTIFNLAVHGELVMQDSGEEPAPALLRRIAGSRSQILAGGEARKKKPVALDGLVPMTLPLGWGVEALANLVDPLNTISYGVLVPGPEVQDGIPFVRVQDLALSGHPARPNKSIAPEIESPYSRTRLKGGEVLLCVVGSIGKVGIAPMSWAGANIARAVCRVSPMPGVDTQYLLILFQSALVQGFFADSTRTLAQPTLNVGLIEQLPVLVPPLAEQQRIVAKVDELMALCDQLEAQLTTTQTDSRRLLEAVLEAALAPA